MPRRIKIVISLYWCVLALNVAANFVELRTLEVLTKIALMPLLGFYLWFGNTFDRKMMVWAVALGFSWLGDIALLFNDSDSSESEPDENTAFALGLLAFAVMHLLYSVIFVDALRCKFTRKVCIAAAVYAPLTLGAIILFALAIGGAWAALVSVYSIVLASMAVLSAAFGAVGLTGSALFVLSDSLIAVRGFLELSWLPSDAVMGALVMLTYGAAQFALTTGFNRSRADEKHEDASGSDSSLPL